MNRLHNVNVVASELLPTPEEVKRALPLTPQAEECVYRARGVVRDILDRKDPRLFVVIGPCSIHDVKAARDYAQRLSALRRLRAESKVAVSPPLDAFPRTHCTRIELGRAR